MPSVRHSAAPTPPAGAPRATAPRRPATLTVARRAARCAYHLCPKVLDVPVFLRTATALVALVVAVWAGYSAVRDRAPSRWQLIGLLVVEAFAAVLVGAAVVSMVAGDRAHEMVTFIGYLVAFLIVPIAGWALARMEPTRWGSVIIAAVGIVEAILVVRLQQVWIGI